MKSIEKFYESSIKKLTYHSVGIQDSLFKLAKDYKGSISINLLSYKGELEDVTSDFQKGEYLTTDKYIYNYYVIFFRGKGNDKLEKLKNVLEPNAINWEHDIAMVTTWDYYKNEFPDAVKGKLFNFPKWFKDDELFAIFNPFYVGRINEYKESKLLKGLGAPLIYPSDDDDDDY